jgi:uncharacterized membrane protein
MKNQIDKYLNNKTFVLLAFILLCFISKTIYLDQKNLWNDEAFSWHISLESVTNLTFISAGDIHPPLYYLVLKLWTILFGDTIFAMRLLSVLFSSFSLIFLYLITTKILGKIWTLAVLTLYLTSPINIYFAQEIRMYALNLFFNLGSVYYFIKILQIRDPDKSKLDINRIFYLLFSIAAIYTHYFSFFVILSQYTFFIIFISVFNTRVKKIISVNLVLILISYIPWIPILIMQMMKGQEWRKSININQLFEKLTLFFKDILLGSYYYLTGSETFLTVLSLMVIIIIITSCYFYISSLKNIIRRSFFSIEFLMYTLVLFSILFSFIISFKKNFIDSRYLSIILPFILVSLISIIQRIKIRPISIFLILIIISLNIYGNFLYFKSDYKSVNYSKIFNKIQSIIKEEDKLIVQPGYYGYIIDYYAHQNKSGFKNTEKYHDLTGFTTDEKASSFQNFYNFYEQIYRINQHWEFKDLIDSIFFYKIKDFWLLVDYCSDTSTYIQNLERINIVYNRKYYEEFNSSPYEQKLFFFKKDTNENF